MNIILLNNTSDNRQVHKNVTQVAIITGEIKEQTSVSNCKIKIAYRNINSFNYCYIEEFGRYYYITDKEVLSGQHVVLTLRCDVLMSFYDSFKNSRCIAKRSTSNYNDLLEDGAVAKLPQPQYIYRKLPNSFTPSSAGCYVLTVGGR